jgi:hypothetical protein
MRTSGRVFRNAFVKRERNLAKRAERGGLSGLVKSTGVDTRRHANSIDRQKAKRHGTSPWRFALSHLESPQAFQTSTDAAYWLAPEAGAAAAADADASEAAAPASEAAVEAEAAASLAAAAAPDAAAAESEAAAAGAEAAVASLAGAADWSLLLLHAASATAANRDATRRDFFMITSFYG